MTRDEFDEYRKTRYMPPLNRLVMAAKWLPWMFFYIIVSLLTLAFCLIWSFFDAYGPNLLMQAWEAHNEDKEEEARRDYIKLSRPKPATTTEKEPS